MASEIPTPEIPEENKVVRGTCRPGQPLQHYGIPNPIFSIPLVRVNGVVQDMQKGSAIDPCYLPPTTLIYDPCDYTLQVNEAQLDLTELIHCLKVAVGAKEPTNAPSKGYLPLFFNLATENLHVYAGGRWHKVKG